MNFSWRVTKLLREAVTDPKAVYVIGKAFMRGCLYILYYRWFRKNVRIKLPFMSYSRVKISGPGAVFIDKGCSVFANAFDGLNIVTLSADAQVHIGKGCDLGGMTIRCCNKVIIGDKVMSANCLVQDTLFAMTIPTNLRAASMDGHVTSNGIWIGKSVWLASQAIVLYGSKIGDGSVLSTGSVCWNLTVLERHLAVGNPMLPSISIDRINALLGR